MVSLDSLHRIVKGAELDVSVHGLASNSFHYYVDGLVSIIEDPRIAAEKRNHLSALGRKRNLERVAGQKVNSFQKGGPSMLTLPILTTP